MHSCFSGALAELGLRKTKFLPGVTLFGESGWENHVDVIGESDETGL
jgi:hypothetical protein